MHFGERSSPAIPIASRSGESRARRMCCSPPEPARRWRRKAACATASSSSPSTSSIRHPIRNPIRNPQSAIRNSRGSGWPVSSTANGSCRRRAKWCTASTALAGRVRAARVDRYDALVLGEHPVPVDPEIAAPLLADAWLERGPRDARRRLLRRLRFVGQEADVAALVRTAAYGVRSLDDVRLEQALSPDLSRALDATLRSRSPSPAAATRRSTTTTMAASRRR